MPGSRASTDPEHKSPRESGEDSEDESEILEESPCGRWLKRREEVNNFVSNSKSGFLLHLAEIFAHTLSVPAINRRSLSKRNIAITLSNYSY